jgi:hypothetical protein
MHGRVKEMEATLKEVESALHDLKLIQRGEKPVVKLFEGREALKAIQDDILTSQPKEVDEFGNLDEILRIYSREEMRDFQRQMNRFQHRMRGLFLAKKEELKKDEIRQIESLPAEHHEFGGDVLVYGDKVALSTFGGKQISVLIESSEIAKTVRAMFNDLWRCRKKQ